MTARSHSRSRVKAAKRNRRRVLRHMASAPRPKRKSSRRRIAAARNRAEVERTVGVINERRSK